MKNINKIINVSFSEIILVYDSYRPKQIVNDCVNRYNSTSGSDFFYKGDLRSAVSIPAH